MKTTSFLLLLSLLTFGACKKDCHVDAPNCIQSKISVYKQDCCNDAKVDRYSFQNQTVYVFEPGSCGADMSAEVVDANCNTLGFLGGITGNTKINGQEFSTATNQHTIWHK